MPILSFKRADILRAQNLENEHWYSWEITECSQKPNKNKNGVNLSITFRLIDTGSDLDGKEITSTNCLIANGKSFLSNYLPLIAAVKGIAASEIPVDGFEYDTDEMVGKKVDGKHILDTFEGQLVAKIESFLPYKTASKAPAF